MGCAEANVFDNIKISSKDFNSNSYLEFFGKNTIEDNLTAIVLDNTGKDEKLTRQKRQKGIYSISAYCPCEKCCGKWADKVTFSGTKAQEGRTISVDPKIIPLGTRVLIDGHEYIAEDVGGAIKGNKLDMFFNSHQDALKWGVQKKEVEIFIKG